jgi:hypothetical protein
MNALDVISLQQAKDFLRVDFDDDDSLITSIISASVTLVEQKTQYRLYQRIEVLHSDGMYNVDVFQMPLNNITVTTLDGTPYTNVQILRQPVRTTVQFKFGQGSGYWANPGFGAGFDNGITFWPYPASLPLFNINVDCGYLDTTLIPVPLIQACKQLITYFYENRDWATAEVPNNVMVLLSPFIRDPMF